MNRVIVNLTVQRRQEMFTNKEYVYEVYKLRSFSKAADKLFISQPSLSATIKRVEERLGTALFDRSVYPIQLTDCGAEYIKCVEKIHDIENGFHNYMNDLNELEAGSLTIGAPSFFASASVSFRTFSRSA